MKITSLSLIAALFLSSCQEVGRTLVHEAKKEQQKASTPATPEKRKLTTGKVSRVNEETQITNELNLKDGVKEGEAKSYYPSGELWKKVNYQNGKLHGLAKVYDEKGNLKRSVAYKDGKKNGLYTKYFRSGKERLQIEYFEDIPLPGILRRNYMGEIIPEPTIKVRQKGKVSTNPDVYQVEFVLSEKLKDTRFYGLALDQSWQELAGKNLNDYRMPNMENVGLLQFQIEHGYFLSNEHYVYAEFEVEKGLRAVVKQKVNYAIENR